MRIGWGFLLGATLLLLAAWQALPALQAYTTGKVNSGDGLVSIVAVPVTPSGNPRPLVYCTATDESVTAGSNVAVTITCFNGLAHSIDLAVSYSASSSTTPPTYSPPSPLAITVASDSSASAALTVQTTLTTTPGTYTISYSAQITGNPSVAVSFGFSSVVTVTG